MEQIFTSSKRYDDGAFGSHNVSISPHAGGNGPGAASNNQRVIGMQSDDVMN